MKRKIKFFMIVAIFMIVVTLAMLPHVLIGKLLNTRMDVEQYDLSNLNAREVELITEDGLKIESWLIEAASPKATVIILSGIEKPSVTAFSGYSQFLFENGYSSLLIEMRAHGGSEGDRVALGMEEYLDVKAGVEYLDKNYLETPIVVWGNSMGAATALVSIGEIPEIDAAISCSAFSSWTDVYSDLLRSNGFPEFLVIVERPFSDLYIGLKYGFGKLKYNPKNSVEKLNGRPILLAHSTEDSQVPFANYERIADHVQNSEISSFIREGDEHYICYDEYFQSPEEDELFAEAIINFLSEHFPK